MGMRGVIRTCPLTLPLPSLSDCLCRILKSRSEFLFDVPYRAYISVGGCASPDYKCGMFTQRLADNFALSSTAAAATPLCEFTIAPAGCRGEWSAESAHGSPS